MKHAFSIHAVIAAFAIFAAPAWSFEKPTFLSTVEFSPGSTVLSTHARAKLQELIHWTSSDAYCAPDAIAIVVGHSSVKPYDPRLLAKRGAVIRDFLFSNGIAAAVTHTDVPTDGDPDPYLFTKRDEATVEAQAWVKKGICPR